MVARNFQPWGQKAKKKHSVDTDEWLPGRSKPFPHKAPAQQARVKPSSNVLPYAKRGPDRGFIGPNAKQEKSATKGPFRPINAPQPEPKAPGGRSAFGKLVQNPWSPALSKPKSQTSGVGPALGKITGQAKDAFNSPEDYREALMRRFNKKFKTSLKGVRK